MQFVENATQTRVFSNSNNLNLRRMRGTQLTERCHSLEFVGLGLFSPRRALTFYTGECLPAAALKTLPTFVSPRYYWGRRYSRMSTRYASEAYVRSKKVSHPAGGNSGSGLARRLCCRDCWRGNMESRRATRRHHEGGV